MHILTPAAAVVLTMAVAQAGHQSPVDPTMPPVSTAQRLLEAGQYAQALQAIAAARQAEAAGPHEAFLAAHVYLRQNQTARAKEEFGRLVADDDPVWQLVGQSSIALADLQLDRALELAREGTATIAARDADPDAPPPAAPPPVETLAVPEDPGLRLHDFHAWYQLGLVLAKREDWAGSAEAFERASRLNPAFAYAHYYAGLAYSRVKQLDKVVSHFELFLKLAPTAPERTAVATILRSVRGG